MCMKWVGVRRMGHEQLSFTRRKSRAHNTPCTPIASSDRANTNWYSIVFTRGPGCNSMCPSPWARSKRKGARNDVQCAQLAAKDASTPPHTGCSHFVET